MPHHEIERFLKSFANSLGGSPKRNADITDELRDHLESHIQEAASNYPTHGEAIQRAISEFGDSARFAAHLKRSARRRRLKRALRGCTAPLVGVAAAAILAITVWPSRDFDRGTLRYAEHEREETGSKTPRAELGPKFSATANCHECHDGKREETLSTLSGATQDYFREFPGSGRPPAADLVDGFQNIAVGCQETPHVETGLRPAVEGEGC